MLLLGSRAVCQMLRLLPRTSCIHEGLKLRGVTQILGLSNANSPSYFMHRRDLLEVSQSEVHPFALFNAESLLKNLKYDHNTNKRLKIEQTSAPNVLEDARRLSKSIRLEEFKDRLHKIPADNIPQRELLQESDYILVLHRNVHLRPHKVVQILEEMVPEFGAAADPWREELAHLQKSKTEIDREAQKRVKGELAIGLGFVGVQTAVLMRLTFWELSWDVMEPICFFLTSIYFMVGYGFFLRTSINPTFEGIFRARFRATQKRLIRKRNFDVERYRELRMSPWLRCKSLRANKNI